MSFPRYPEYKDSGVEWLGEVPAAWNVKRLRFAAQLNPSKSEVAGESRDTEVSFLPMEAVGDDGTLNLERTRPIAAVESGYTYFREGDVTVAKITPCFENGKGAVMRGLLGGFGFGTTELTVARPREGQTSSEYLHWMFSSSPFRALGEASMYGAGGQKRVPDDFFRDFAFAFPPPAEQTAIAAFLDRETAKIDALVAEQETLIALLKEKRQAVISHAVTKGLNPDAPMKPSGIEWLGGVPAHWEVVSIRRIATRVDTGGTPTSISPSEEFHDGVPWVTPGDFKGNVSLDTSAKSIPRAIVESGEAKLFPAGCVLIVSIGATLGKVAFSPTESSANQQVNAVIPDERIDGYFLAYSLTVKTDVMRFLSNASTIGIMNQEKTKEISIALPPKDEQVAIGSFLDRHVANTEKLIEQASYAIILLKERRSALISAAVTGQIDVRGLEG